MTKREEKITNEERIKQAEQHAEELTQSLGRKVSPLIFVAGDDIIIGYIKEISRIAKLRILDSALVGGFSACESLVDDCLLKEGDYAKIIEEDVYYIGVVNEINNMIKVAQNQFKKK